MAIAERFLRKALQAIQAHERFGELVEMAESYYPRIVGNPLRIVSSLVSEVVYTRLLAYLFDSTEDHDLGTLFCEGWIHQLGLPIGRRSPVQEVRCTTEWQTAQGRYIDLVLEIKLRSGQRHVIAIENKTWSSESTNQLSDYQAALSLEYGQLQSRLLVFLSPDGRPPATHDLSCESVPVIPVGYQTIRNQLIELTRSVQELPIAKFLAQFSELIELELLPRGETMMKAQQLVHRMLEDDATRKAIDLLRMAYQEDLTTRNLFYENVQSVVRKDFPNVEIAWHYPNSSPRPHEFNFDFQLEPISAISNQGCSIYLMSLIQQRSGKSPRIGDKVGTYVMAYKNGLNKVKREETRRQLADLLEKLPPSQGQAYQWGPWMCLWTGRNHQLEDMSRGDGEAIAANLVDAMNSVRNHLFV